MRADEVTTMRWSLAEAEAEAEAGTEAGAVGAAALEDALRVGNLEPCRHLCLALPQSVYFVHSRQSVLAARRARARRAVQGQAQDAAEQRPIRQPR